MTYDEEQHFARLERRLGKVEAMMLDYADALIEIAAAFGHWSPAPGKIWAQCRHCDRTAQTGGCKPICPGLLARKALGVA